MGRFHLFGTLAAILVLSLLTSTYLFQNKKIALIGNKPIAPLPSPSKSPAFGVLKTGSDSLVLDGKPLFLNGDAAWSLLVVPSEQDAIEYLRTRHAQGFNAVLVNLVEHFVGGPRNHNGDLPFVGEQNFMQPNEAYFKHADRVFAEASRLGMIVLLAPAYLGYECGVEGWCAVMQKVSVHDLQHYGEYLGQRYSQYRNIIWVHGGDADARRFNIMEKVAAVAKGISLAGGKQLNTAHCARDLAGNECYANLHLDFDTAYASCTTTSSAIARMHQLNAKTAKHSGHFVYIEGIYENMKESPDCIRDQFLLAMLGGASGHVFGNQPVWDFGNNWKLNLDSPGSRMISSLWRALEPTRSGKWSIPTPYTSSKGSYFTPLRRNMTNGSILFYVKHHQTIDAALLTSNLTLRTCWLDLQKLDMHSKLNSFAPNNALRDSIACSDVKPGLALTPPHVSDWLALAVPYAGRAQHPWSHF